MKPLTKYYRACDELRDQFIEKYHKDEDGDCQEYYWIAEEVGGMLLAGDQFYSMHDIVNAIAFEMTFDELYDWYYWTLDYGMAGEAIPLNMKNFLRVYREDKTKLPKA